MKYAFTLLVFFYVLPLSAELATKEQYQPIIDAKPFGDVSKYVSEQDAATAVEEQKKKEEIAQKFRMCGITDTPSGERKIAFLDETSGAIASYILAVGETQNGFKLIAADYDREHATLTKDGITFTLGLGKGLIDQPPEVSEEDIVEVVTPKKIEMRSNKPVGKGSFKARLLQRQAKKAEAEQAKKEAIQEAMTKQLEAANRRKEIERIKQGLAPTVPINLTPEEDAELEAAGVFGPREEPPQEVIYQDAFPQENIQQEEQPQEELQ